MTKNFFITTPIYYPSGKPHMGHAYSSILTDIIAYLKHRSGINEKFHIDTNASFTCEPFTERFDNALFGWVMDLSIRTQWDYSDCLDVFGERDSQVKSTSNCLR